MEFSWACRRILHTSMGVTTRTAWEGGGLGGIGSLKDLSDSETLHRGEAYLFHHGVGRNRSAAYLRTVADSNAWAEECKAPPTSMPHQP